MGPSNAKAETKKPKAKESKKFNKNQGTLDEWVKGGRGEKKKPGPKPGTKPAKRLTAAEREEQNRRFKEEMQRRIEEAKKKKLEEKAREKERKKEEKKLLDKLMNEWKQPREDLECDDHKELPCPHPVHCKIPNQLFGEFLTLLEFCRSFEKTMDVEETFGSSGITFDKLLIALTDRSTMGGALYKVLKLFLNVLFDLQVRFF